MNWRLYLAIFITGVLLVDIGIFFFAPRSIDCAVPPNCLVGKMLFYGAWRAAY